MAVSHAKKSAVIRQAIVPPRFAGGGTAKTLEKNTASLRKKHPVAATPFPASFGQHLWKNIAAYSVFVCAFCAALMLAFFIRETDNALSRLSLQTSPPPNTASANFAYAPAQTAYKSKNRQSFLQTTAKHNHAALAQTAEEQTADVPHTDNAAAKFYDNRLRFLHSGLLYSSFLTLIAGIGLTLLLIYFMLRDKRHTHSYQTAVTKAAAAAESRIRHRTAHLQTARRNAEKERERAELLLQDSSHRIGNSLATVSSLLGLQLRSCHDSQAQKALLSAQDRIQAISSAHRRLRLSQDMESAAAGDFLTAIIHDIENGLTAKQRRHITIRTNFEQWFLPARDVTTLGIILGELLTNAVKHAFPHRQNGIISVSFGKFGGKTLRLMVKDNGIGLTKTAKSPAAHTDRADMTKTEKQEARSVPQGLGQQIVRQLAAQFGSEPQFTNGKTGGSLIIIPLRHCRAKQKPLSIKKIAA